MSAAIDVTEARPGLIRLHYLWVVALAVMVTAIIIVMARLVTGI